MNDQIQNTLDSFTENQLAAVSTAVATLLGSILSYGIITLGLSRAQLIVAGAVFGFIVLMAGTFTLLRALIFSAKKTNDTPISALTHPTFITLFLLLTLASGVVIGVYARYIGV